MYQTSHYSLACLDDRAGQNCWAVKIWRKKKTNDLDLLGSTAYRTPCLHYVTTRRCRCCGMSLLALKCSNCIWLFGIKVSTLELKIIQQSHLLNIGGLSSSHSIVVPPRNKSGHLKQPMMKHLQSQTVETTMINTAVWNSSRKLTRKSESFMFTMCSNIDMIASNINLWFSCRNKTGMIFWQIT